MLSYSFDTMWFLILLFANEILLNQEYGFYVLNIPCPGYCTGDYTRGTVSDRGREGRATLNGNGWEQIEPTAASAGTAVTMGTLVVSYKHRSKHVWLGIHTHVTN